MKYKIMPEFETATYRDDDFDIYNFFDKELNKYLVDKSYSSEVTDFFHVVRIYFEPHHYKAARQYSKKEKLIAISINVKAEHYVKIDNKKDMAKFMATSLIEVISLLKEVKRLPKDFEINKFKEDMISFFKKKGWLD